MCERICLFKWLPLKERWNFISLYFTEVYSYLMNTLLCSWLQRCYWKKHNNLGMLKGTWTKVFEKLYLSCKGFDRPFSLIGLCICRWCTHKKLYGLIQAKSLFDILRHLSNNFICIKFRSSSRYFHPNIWVQTKLDISWGNMMNIFREQFTPWSDK